MGVQDENRNCFAWSCDPRPFGVFQKGKNTTCEHVLTTSVVYNAGISPFQQSQHTTKTPAVSLQHLKWGLGIPKQQKQIYDIDGYALLVLSRVLYINCIALAIGPLLG